MTKPSSSSLAILLTCTALFACSQKQAPPAEAPASEAPAEPASDAPAQAERPAITTDECTAQGGSVVGDIGDGAIHRPDYRCPSGAEPSGSIKQSSDGPVAVEGSVCCPG
jgi:hypothetical protein